MSDNTKQPPEEDFVELQTGDPAIWGKGVEQPNEDFSVYVDEDFDEVDLTEGGRRGLRPRTVTKKAKEKKRADRSRA